MIRLSIDEVIDHCKRKVQMLESFSSRKKCESWSLDSQFGKDYWEHRQVADWLEELKEARKGFNENRKAGYKHGYSDGYAKAIDEFAEKLMTDVESFVAEVNGIRADLLTIDYFCEFVDEVAEQMKEVRNDY